MGRSPANEIDPADLSAWLDGELSEEAQARLEEELARNPQRKADLDELESVVAFVRAQGPAHAPPDFTARLLQRIDQEEAPRSRSWRDGSGDGGRRGVWWRRPLGIPLEGWAVGLAAAAAVLLIVLPDRGRSPTGGDGEQTWSPAALEGTPSLNGVPTPRELTAPPRTDASDLPPVPRATKGAPPVAKQAPFVEEPPPVDVLPPPDVVGSTDRPFFSTEDGPVPPLGYRVKSADPAMKRKVLAIVARYGQVVSAEGEVATAEGVPEPDASMTAPTERLRVSVRQDELPFFQQDLFEAGFTVQRELSGELAGRKTVEVELLLVQTTTDP